VGQLVAHARTGDWLRTDHLVELLTIWANGNGTQLGWLERVNLGHLSEQVDGRFAGLAMFADTITLAKLFTNGWRLDFRSPVACTIYSACKRKLNNDGEWTLGWRPAGQPVPNLPPVASYGGRFGGFRVISGSITKGGGITPGPMRPNQCATARTVLNSWG
jgi:hypothetical protein